MTSPVLQEITVSLPTDLVQYMQDEAAKRHINPADVLQQAIVNDRYLREQQSNGLNVLLEKDAKFSKLAI